MSGAEKGATKRSKRKRPSIIGPNPPWSNATRPRGDSRPSAYDLFRCSRSFLRAYWTLDESDPEHAWIQYSPVFEYLLAHSLELGLKAFLAARGRTQRQLVDDVGHDLVRALSDAEREGLSRYVAVLPEDKRQLDMLNEPYEAKHLEYEHTTYNAAPRMRDGLAHLAAALLDGIFDVCAEADEDPDDVRECHEILAWKLPEIMAGSPVVFGGRAAGRVWFYTQSFEHCPFDAALYFHLRYDSGLIAGGHLEGERMCGEALWLRRRGLGAVPTRRGVPSEPRGCGGEGGP